MDMEVLLLPLLPLIEQSFMFGHHKYVVCNINACTSIIS